MRKQARRLLPTLGLAALFSQIALADMSASVDQMCDKMKTCAVAEMVKEGDIPPEMVESMSGMFDGMCQQMLAQHTQAIGTAGLEDKAQACVDTMLDSSCEQLMQSQGEFKSPACNEFSKAAEGAGLKTQ